MQHAGGLSQLKIKIENKTYPGANGEPEPAVRDFELKVQKESFTALIGPSGCGKTTILKIVSGLDSDFKGTIQWAEDPRIGFVFQDPRLLSWRTVRQNILLTSAAEFDPKDLEEITQELGIAGFLDRFPGELSLGLARRASLARAYAAMPNVLLLDEPFVSLDEPTAERLRKMLARVWLNRPVTAIMVTHNIREAIELADQLVLVSPRPTTLIAEVPLETPRSERTKKHIEDIRNKLAENYPAYFSHPG